MAGRHHIDELRKKMGPERVAKAKARAREMHAEMLLTELRQIQGITQVELAHKLGIKQPAISQLEQQTDMQISTLQRLVKALGGVLEITIRFPNDNYRLGQFDALTSQHSKR